MAKPFIKFKQPKQGTTLMFLHPLIVIVMFDMANWCSIRGIPVVITDTISTVKKDQKLFRISDSHRTFRAFDMRSRVFTEVEKEAFIKYFNEKYEEIASVSSSDYVSRLVVEHGEGDSEHFHVALHSRFKINY